MYVNKLCELDFVCFLSFVQFLDADMIKFSDPIDTLTIQLGAIRSRLFNMISFYILLYTLFTSIHWNCLEPPGEAASHFKNPCLRKLEYALKIYI